MADTKPAPPKKPGWWRRVTDAALEILANMIYQGPR